MDILKGLDLEDLGRPQDGPDEMRPRILGSPIPLGPGTPAPAPNPPPDPGRATAAATAVKGFAGPAASATPAAPLTGLQKAMNVLRMAVPIVQRLLPLIDGQVASTVSNMLAPHTPAHAVQQTSDSLALQDGLLELKTRQRDLRDRIAEQNVSLKRVEDRLDKVREATDRNTMEQQEVVEDLKKLSNKVRIFAVAGMLLLAVSIALNIVLVVLFQHHLP
jgi:hypothetical protein